MKYKREKPIIVTIFFGVLDLLLLMGRIFGFDTDSYIVIASVISFIAGNLFIKCLENASMRWEANRKDDWEIRIGMIAGILGFAAICVFLYFLQ